MVDTIVRSIVVNVGNIEPDDSRIRYLFTHPDSGLPVYGLEFPIHKPNRSLKISGREHVGRDQDTPAFFPSPPLATGQDTQTEAGCAVSAVENVPAADAEGNYVQLAFIYYDPAAPTIGICAAWIDVQAANGIAAARFSDMSVVATTKYVPRQSNITLAVLGGNTSGITPGTLHQPGLCITGLTGQLEYEIFA